MKRCFGDIHDEIDSSQGGRVDGCAELGVSATLQARLVRRSKPASNVHMYAVQNSDHNLVSYTMSSKQEIQAAMEGDDYKSARCKVQYQQRQKHQHHGAIQSLN